MCHVFDVRCQTTGGMCQALGVTCHLSRTGVMCQMFVVMCHKSIVRKDTDRATYCLLRCHVSHVQCQLLNVRCQMSDIPCQVSDVMYYLSHVRKANSKSQHRPLIRFYFRCQVSGVMC